MHACPRVYCVCASAHVYGTCMAWAWTWTWARGHVQVFDRIIERTREECKAGGGKGSLVSDINHQNKAGKTPLYLAVEFVNYCACRQSHPSVNCADCALIVC